MFQRRAASRRTASRGCSRGSLPTALDRPPRSAIARSSEASSKRLGGWACLHAYRPSPACDVKTGAARRGDVAGGPPRAGCRLGGERHTMSGDAARTGRGDPRLGISSCLLDRVGGTADGRARRFDGCSTRRRPGVDRRWCGGARPASAPARTAEHLRFRRRGRSGRTDRDPACKQAASGVPAVNKSTRRVRRRRGVPGRRTPPGRTHAGGSRGEQGLHRARQAGSFTRGHRRPPVGAIDVDVHARLLDDARAHVAEHDPELSAGATTATGVGNVEPGDRLS